MKKIQRLFITAAFVCTQSFAALPSIELNIQGIDGDIKQNVIEKLQTEATSADFNEWYANADANIKQAMAPYGYFSPQVKKTYQYKNKAYYVHFIITKEQPVRVNSIVIDISGEGKFNDAICTVIEKNPLKSGDVLLTQQYEKFKSDVLEVSNEQGFIKSYWQVNRIEVDQKNHSAAINLNLETHKRYYFGSITFHQAKYAYAPTFLQRFSLSAPKGYFSSTKLIDYQQQLAMSPYFREVNIAPDLSAQSTSIPLHAEVAAPPAKKHTLGVGYSTWSGPRLLAGSELRHLNDIGHYFSTQVKLSSIISALSAKYYIPGYNPLTQQWTLGANIQRFLPKNGSSSASTIQAAYSLKYKYWQSDVALNYLVEQYKVYNSNLQTSAYIYPSLNVSSTVTDDPINPMQGYNINLTLRGTPKTMVSSTDFLQGLLTAKYLFSLYQGSQVILRAGAGYTIVKDISNLPLTLRFYTGGANSIRGYPDSSIGPGKYLMLGSLEWQQRVYGNWKAAIFYDQGKAANHLSSPWSTSVGVGAIYSSIIGPVKLYLAQDISLKNKPYRVEFSFGPEF